MAEYCTCGAKLPDDARFCHKCGKPQYELLIPDEETPREPVATTPPPPPPGSEINFRNTVAVRVAFLAAGITSLLIFLPLPPYFALGWLPVCLCAAGFLAVFLYIRRTGHGVSVRSGARIGWITGTFCFAIATVFMTLTVIALSSGGGLVNSYRDQFRSRGLDDPNVRQLLEVLQNPAGMATILLLSLLFLFVLCTLLPTMGGAFGAKVLAKE